MTRKHHIGIAEVIQETRLEKEDKARLIEKLSSYFMTENYNFNIVEFISACYADNLRTR